LLVVVGCWLLLVVGCCWLLVVVGCWLLLVVGCCWLLVVVDQTNMPEIPEIHQFKNAVNEFIEGVTFTSTEFLVAESNKHPQFKAPYPCHVRATARGKEIKLIFGGNFEVVFFHGLFGGWLLESNSGSKMEGEGGKAMVVFRAEGGKSITFRGFSPYWRVGTWGEDRGPDPYEEFDAFRQNIMTNLQVKAMTAPLYEIMLNQKYFSGVGNYLRAEVVYRARINPFQSLQELFKKDQEAGELLLKTTSAAVKEVVEGRINKYGTKEEKERFQAWTKCYDKSTSKMVVDKSKRKFFYVPSQYSAGAKKTQETAPSLSPLKPSTSSLSTQPKPSFQPQQPAIQSQQLQLQPQLQQNVQQPVTFSTGGDDVGREEGDYPPAVELMLLVHECYHRSLLTLEDKKIIKQTVFQPLTAPTTEKNNRLKWLLFSSVEAFKADGDHDFEEFSDSIKRIVRLLRGY